MATSQAFLEAEFLSKILAKAGKPYIWANKGPDAFDCSGMVTWGLYEASGHKMDWRANYNSQRLFNVCRELRQPEGVCLAFYGPSTDKIDHVMTFVNDGTGRVFGACGGGHTTITLAEAARVDAKVRYRPAFNYRADFRGFRSLPIASMMAAIATV